MDRAFAALAYVPVPGVAWLAARARADDRFVRFHARQAGVTTAVAWLLLLAIGTVDRAASLPPDVVGALAGPVLVVWLAALAWGVAGAIRGRFVRIRGVADALAALPGRKASA